MRFWGNSQAVKKMGLLGDPMVDDWGTPALPNWVAGGTLCHKTGSAGGETPGWENGSPGGPQSCVNGFMGRPHEAKIGLSGDPNTAKMGLMGDPTEGKMGLLGVPEAAKLGLLGTPCCKRRFLGEPHSAKKKNRSCGGPCAAWRSFWGTPC